MTEFEPRESTSSESQAVARDVHAVVDEEAPNFDRALRPTSPLEMLDRAFLIWRQGATSFLLYGLGMEILPAVAQTIFLLRENSSTPERVFPWLFAALLVQVFFATLIFRRALHLCLGRQDTARFNVVLLHIFPRVTVVGLFYMSGIVLSLLPLSVIVSGETTAPLQLLFGVGGMALAIWFTATFALSMPLAALSEESVFAALAWSRRLMVGTRFGSPWWRDGAYLRLFLVILLPLAAGLLLQVVAHFARLWQTHSVMVADGQPLTPTLLLVWAAAALDLLIVPWMCIGVSVLVVECLIRHQGLDLAMNLGESGIDSSPAST